MAYKAEHYAHLHLIAPRALHRKLIQNNPWLQVSCQKAAELFNDSSLRGPAVVMATSHQSAIDYIEQAPVLVLAVAKNKDLAVRADRDFVWQQFGTLCSVGPRLKDLLRFYGAAPQLRALSGYTLRRDHYRILNALSGIPPSRLAQVIPKVQAEQEAWLASAAQWRQLALRVTKEPDWIAGWAAANACHKECPTEPTQLIDFAHFNRATFDKRWSIADAEAACERWHAEILERNFAADYSEDELSEAAIYEPLPDEAKIEGHQFVALRTRSAVFEEGQAMHHCVAMYADRMLRGRCWLYSVRCQEKRVATVELRRQNVSFSLAQIRAHCNRKAPRAAYAAAIQFISVINSRLNSSS